MGFVLAFVVLSVAISKTTNSTELFGFAIGACVTVGGNAIGGVSGGSLNPAVSLGLGLMSLQNFAFYALVELVAGAVAGGVFRVIQRGPDGYENLLLQK